MSKPWYEDIRPLTGNGVTLRELRIPDAPTLFAVLTEDQVVKFISPPPTSPVGFEKFIHWAIAQRKAGRYVCFGVVPEGLSEPVGIFQLRQLDSASNVAEWGFILGYPFWGTGVFPEAARLMLEFAFDAVGVNRLEARAAVPNGRGQGALSKIGAVHEVRLRESFYRNGIRFDQVMWSILADEWREQERQRHEDRTRRGGPGSSDDAATRSLLTRASVMRFAPRSTS